MKGAARALEALGACLLWLWLGAGACSQGEAGPRGGGGSTAAGAGANGGGSGGSTAAGAGANGGGGSGGSTAAGAGAPTDNATAGSGAAGAGSGGAAGCNTPDLTWKSARKTYYTAYPDPNSEECIAYNGCTWAGQFAACSGKKSEAWVQQHDIVAAFPDFASLKLHDLCLRSGDKTIVVTVLDTCADSDCSGCCTRNQGDADALIDLESYTNARWGVEDGRIEWADLGPTQGDGCN